MKRTVLGLVVLLSSASGCSWLCGGAVPRSTLEAMRTSTKEILPQYKAYVAADPDLADMSKKIRTQNADKLRSLIHKALKQDDE